MSPTEASKLENANQVYENLFPHNPEEEMLESRHYSRVVFESQGKPAQCATRFNIGDTVRITKYKAVFAKGYLPNWSTEMFKISNVYPGEVTTYSIKDLADEEILGKFYEEELTLFNNVKEEYKIEKILKRRTRKGVKEIFVKWYGYPEKFNSWIPA